MVTRKQAQLKKTLAQALHNVEKAAERLAVLHKQFEPTHPDHAAYLSAQIRGLLTIQEFMLDFWEKCWGKRPPDYNTWRQ